MPQTCEKALLILVCEKTITLIIIRIIQKNLFFNDVSFVKKSSYHLVEAMEHFLHLFPLFLLKELKKCLSLFKKKIGNILTIEKY